MESGGKPEKKLKCKSGHEVEIGKSVSSAGYCNLCIKDMQRGRAAGTTAKARGLCTV